MMEEETAELHGPATFESIGNGRIRCVETGHEMPETAKEEYASSKRCKAALFDRALSQRRPPFTFFEQSPISRDKIICQLTGATVNKIESAVWKHILGRKFQNRLKEVEEKKKKKPESESEPAVDETVNSEMKLEGSNTNSKAEKGQNKDRKKKKEKQKIEKEQKQKQKQENENENEDEDSDTEFWIPPESPVKTKKEKKKMMKKKKKHMGLKVIDDEMIMSVIDESGEEGEEEKELDDSEGEIRLKRLSLCVGPSSYASRKKKARINS